MSLLLLLSLPGLSPRGGDWKAGLGGWGGGEKHLGPLPASPQESQALLECEGAAQVGSLSPSKVAPGSQSH